MKTKQNKNLLVVGAVLIACLIAIGFSSSIQGSSYEIKPEITLPEHRTDTARKLTDISTRMAKIEKALGIQQSPKPVEKASKNKSDMPDTQKVELEGL